MAALQLLGIACYSASLRLALHHHKRTLHPVQLIFLGLSTFFEISPIDLACLSSQLHALFPSLKLHRFQWHRMV
jgi:hypothetical protein